MAIQSLALPKPLRDRKEFTRRDFALRDQAISEFESGRQLDAVHTTLRYLLSELVEQVDLATAPLCVVQGSARVRIELLNKSRDSGTADGSGHVPELRVRSYIARLKKSATGEDLSQVPAALRFFLSSSAGTGQLAQPRLGAEGEHELIYLDYRDPLALLHPQKLIEVLGRLPIDADRYDQWIAQQFNLEAHDREPLGALTDEEFNHSYAAWQAHWAALDELQTESRRRRSVRFLNFLASFSNSYISYCLPLVGQLRALLAEAADVYNNRDENPDKRDNALAKCIKSMRALSAEELRASLGHGQFALNPLYEGSGSLLSQILGAGQSMQGTADAKASGRSLDAAFELITNYAYLLAYHSWPAEIEASLREALDAASDKPWREAAESLWSHANACVKRFGSHAGENVDGDSDGPDGAEGEEDGAYQD